MNILFLAFALRAAVPIIVIFTTGDYSLFYNPDTLSYVRPAEELLSHGLFYSEGLPVIFRTPGYPLFLIPGIVLGKVETVTIALQIILGCLTTYLVFRVALTLFEDERIAGWGALAYAIEPVSILYASKLLSETLSAFLTILFAFYLLKYFKAESVRTLLIASILLSISVYVRPAGYFLPMVIAMVLVIRSLKKRKAVLFAHALGFLACSILIIGAWQLRNQKQADYPGFAAVSDYILCCYKAASVQAAQEGVPFNEMQRRMGCFDKRIYPENHPGESFRDRGKIYRSMGKEGIKIILREPLTYVLIHARGMVSTILDPGITEYLIMFKRYSWSLGQLLGPGLFDALKDFASNMPIFFFGLFTLLGIHLVALLYSVVAAFLYKGFPHSVSTAAILCIVAYYLLVPGGPGGYHRFRIPIMPLVCVFSAYGFYLLQGRLGRKKSGNCAS